MEGTYIIAGGIVVLALLSTGFAWLSSRAFDAKYGARERGE